MRPAAPAAGGARGPCTAPSDSAPDPVAGGVRERMPRRVVSRGPWLGPGLRYPPGMARLRRIAWGLLLAGLALYMGRLWLRDLRRELGTLAGAALRLVRGTWAGFDAPLHPVSEAAVTLAVIAAWVVLAMAVIRRGPVDGLTLGGRLAPASLLLAVAGVAALVALLLATLVPALAGPPLLVIATVIAIGVLGAVASRAGGGGPPDAIPDAPAPGFDIQPGPDVQLSSGRIARLLRLGVALVSAAALALLVVVLARDAIHLAFYRPAAAGDELSFWWRATDVLHQSGWDRYLATFDSAGYVPGYPLVANVLFGWLPDGHFAAAGRALPFLYGFLALALLTRGLGDRAGRGRGLRGVRGLLGVPGPATALLLVVGYVLLFEGNWIHSMFFELWYGEAFATVLTILLFVLLDAARRDGRARLPALVLVGVGLGALAAISKPPLSFLLLPAILPTLLLAGAVLRPARRSLRPYLVTLAAVAAGALAANLLWGAQLRAHELGAYYALDLPALLTFHPEGSFGPLVRYVVADYQPTWVAFLLVAGLALVVDPRRFVPFFLVGVGMAASILLLYLGAWSDVEHESGARYLLHGLDGFTIFALAALTPAIRTTLDGRLAWLAGLLAGRPASRPGDAVAGSPATAGTDRGPAGGAP